MIRSQESQTCDAHCAMMRRKFSSRTTKWMTLFLTIVVLLAVIAARRGRHIEESIETTTTGATPQDGIVALITASLAGDEQRCRQCFVNGAIDFGNSQSPVSNFVRDLRERRAE